MNRLTFIGCFIFSIVAYGGTVDSLQVYSARMQREIPTLVIKPTGYETATQPFPTLYLLHGAGGNQTQWISSIPQLSDYADVYQMLIVCPDGGETSWYFDSPIDPTYQYETFIAKELILWIDTHYNTDARREKRAITGLSMGGHGAFYLAIKNQPVWGAAGSMSGGLDIRPFPNNWSIAERLGSYQANPAVWETHTVINLLYLLDKNSLRLIFDCGIGDFFYDVNKKVHQEMLYRNISHDYIERPGAHNWNYWRNAIQFQLLYFSNFFKES